MFKDDLELTLHDICALGGCKPWQRTLELQVFWSWPVCTQIRGHAFGDVRWNLLLRWQICRQQKTEIAFYRSPGAVHTRKSFKSSLRRIMQLLVHNTRSTTIQLLQFNELILLKIIQLLHIHIDHSCAVICSYLFNDHQYAVSSWIISFFCSEELDLET